MNLLVDIFYGTRFVPGGGVLLFVGLLAVCTMITAVALWRQRHHIQPGIDLVPTSIRWAMHGYFLLWAVLLAFVPALRLPGMDMPPILIGVAVALIIVETGLLLLVAHRDRPLRQQIVVVPVVDTEPMMVYRTHNIA